MKKGILTLFALALLMPGSWLHAKSKKYDVLVYGATPAGVCAAVAASRDGASVALVSPYDYVGGLMSGGLSLSDGNQCEAEQGVLLDLAESLGVDFSDLIAIDKKAAEITESEMEEEEVITV